MGQKNGKTMKNGKKWPKKAKNAHSGQGRHEIS